MVPVSITGGAGARRDKGWWYVPRRDLIGVVQVLLEQRRLRFAKDCRELGRVIEEFMAIESKVGDAEVGGLGRMTIWLWRSRWRVGGRRGVSGRLAGGRMGGLCDCQW